MRVPKIENYYDGGKQKEIVKIREVEKANNQVLLVSEKDKTKFIKGCERVIRSSDEYREYVKYLREYIDMTECSFFNNINTNNFKKVKIEIHHEPFTLYDITNIVVNKHIMEGIPLDYFMVAEEVMKIHFQGKVGLIPLSKTVHDLVHDGKIFLPIQACYGKYMDFIDEYYDYMEPYIDILKEKIKVSKQIQDQGYQDLSILDRKYVYLEIDGMTFPKLLEE